MKWHLIIFINKTKRDKRRYYKRQAIIILETLVFSFLVKADVNAQNASVRLDSLFTTLVKNNEFNGNVVVTEKNKVIYQHSFGYADAEHQLLNTGETAFNLASVSKIFTAVVILQLKQRGKLRLDDYFIKYFPDFPWPQITLRHLLSHTSGLPDYQIFEEPYHNNPAKIYTINDLILAFKNDKRGLLFKTGERYSYSNTGFGLLALLVEKLSGMKFQDYLSKYIFRPADMTHTYIQSPLIKVDDKNRAKRYEFLSYAPNKYKIIDSVKSDYIDAFILGGILGPTGVISTTGDMLKFDQSLYGGKLLKPETLEEAFVPTVLNNGEKAITGWKNTLSYYGLGWEILCDSACGKVVWHSGGAAGMVTFFLRNVSRKQTVVILDNVTHRGLHPQGVNAFYILNGGTLFTEKKSLSKVYVAALHKKGADAAAVIFNQFKADSIHYFMDEKELNRLGHDLLNDGYQSEALEVFKLNTFLYPGSFNVYDSYAEALKGVSKKEEAIKMYQKSVELNPKNESAKKVLENLLK